VQDHPAAAAEVPVVIVVVLVETTVVKYHRTIPHAITTADPIGTMPSSTATKTITGEL